MHNHAWGSCCKVDIVVAGVGERYLRLATLAESCVRILLLLSNSLAKHLGRLVCGGRGTFVPVSTQAWTFKPGAEFEAFRFRADHDSIILDVGPVQGMGLVAALLIIQLVGLQTDGSYLTSTYRCCQGSVYQPRLPYSSMSKASRTS